MDVQDTLNMDVDDLTEPVTSTSKETLDKQYLERFVELYPGPVATILGKGSSTFEWCKRENRESNRSMLYTAGCQINNQSLTVTSKFKKKLTPYLNVLEWQCEEISMTGNIVSEDGEPASEKPELWWRNPVGELIGNPAVQDYAPERVYRDERGRS